MAKKKTVLVVDDDPDFVAATRAVLEGAGYAVESASSGSKGLERVRRGGIDCVLLDIMMSRDTEGFHVAQDLKSDPATAEVPIIVLTSISRKTGFEFSPETDGGFLPVEAFLDKPVDPDVLLKRVAEVLKR